MRHALVLAALALVATTACAQEEPGAPKPGDDEKLGGDEKPGAGAKKEEPLANAKDEKDGEWTKTPSGLQFQVLKEGKGGRSPKLGEQVKVSYKGWRDDGFVFDESAKRGGPATFVCGQLVEGWNEALQRMTVGAKWKLRIPPELGYGPQGMGRDIPPNSTLNFELELHDVVFLPEFVKPDPAAQKETASGLRYEVLAEGSGDPPAETDPCELRFALFSPGGKLLQCSEQQGVIKARPVDLNLKFFAEALALMRAGSKLRLEVPPELAFGGKANGPDLPANAKTYWTLELVRISKPLAIPPFEAFDESKMKKTASGLLYEVIREGAADGPHPKMGQTVKVHYAGWLTDGTLFDSSYGRGEPASFALGQVIPGWNEGVPLMTPGAVYRFVIPPKLAYGDRQMGEKIKPGSTLVFRIELLEVEK